MTASGNSTIDTHPIYRHNFMAYHLYQDAEKSDTSFASSAAIVGRSVPRSEAGGISVRQEAFRANGTHEVRYVLPPLRSLRHSGGMFSISEYLTRRHKQDLMRVISPVLCL